MADMRATKEWAELEKILAEFERLELGSEAMGLATNFANQVRPCHGMPRPPGVAWCVVAWCVVASLPAAAWHGFGTVVLCAACWPPTRIAKGVGALNARSARSC